MGPEIRLRSLFAGAVKVAEAVLWAGICGRGFQLHPEAGRSFPPLHSLQGSQAFSGVGEDDWL